MLRTCSVALIGVLSYSMSASAVIIAIEDFDGGSPGWANNLATAKFEDPDGPDQGSLGIRVASTENINFSGNSVFARDLEAEGNEPPLNPYPFVFTFEPVDVTGYTNVILSFDFAGHHFGQSGSYTVILDGEDQAPVVLYRSDLNNTISSPLIPITSTASTVGLRLTGTLNGTARTLEFDNFALNGDPVLAPEPSGLALLGLGGLVLTVRRRH